MGRVALGVEYHGTGFFGWQAQQGLPTIEDSLVAALSQVANHRIELTCAGRTDKGVHALAQVAHFDTSAQRADHNWLLGANTLLPQNIAIKWAQVVPASFHARFSAIDRSYCYMIYNHRSRPACLSNRVTWICYPLDVDCMTQAAQYLLGEHDFSSFRHSQCQAKTAVRTIYQLSVERQSDMIMISIRANAFLHHMVRNIVGVLLVVGSKKSPPQWVLQVLQGRDRRFADTTAPAYGLYLAAVSYPDNYSLPKPQPLNFSVL